MTDSCRQVERLMSLHLDGELPADRRSEVEAHLEACAACRATLEAWSRLGAVAIDILRQAIPSNPLDARAPLPPRRTAPRADGSDRTRWLPWAAALLVGAAGVFLAIQTGTRQQEARLADRPRVAEETPTATASPQDAPDRPTRDAAPVRPGSLRSVSPPPAPVSGLPAEGNASRRPPEPSPGEPAAPGSATAPTSLPDDGPPPPPPDDEPPPPPPLRAETVAIAARIESLHGEVSLLAGPGPKPARAGAALLPGQGIATGGPGSRAVLACPDGTRLAVEADTTLTRVSAPREEDSGRQVVLAHGTLAANVARQPVDRPMRFATPIAEVLVLGTQLTLAVSPEAVRVEVWSGRVRLTRLADRASVDVRGGQVATAAAAGPLTVQPCREMTLSFQDGLYPDPGYDGTRDTTLRQDSPDRGHGALMTCYVDSDDPSGTRQNVCALVRWDLTRIPPGSLVTSATVTLEITSSVKRRPYPLLEILKPWDEEAATWLTAATGTPWDRKGTQGPGDRGRIPLAMTPADVGKGPLTLRLNARGVTVVQSWVNRPAVNQGILFDHDNNPDGMDFKSRETREPSQRPRLTVTFIPPAGSERR